MPMLGHRRLTTFLAPIISAPAVDSIPTMTNAQKLSLPASTAVGTKVKVTDGFVVSGSGNPLWDTFWFPDGTQDGKPFYRSSRDPINSFGGWVAGDAQWEFPFNPASNDVAYPWLAGDFALEGTPLTHPAVQQLAAPNTTAAGFFVTGLVTISGVGYYTDRGVQNGKRYYVLLGLADDDLDHAISWTPNGGPSGDAWTFNPADIAIYSPSATATPDLATSWVDGNGDPVSQPVFNQVDHDELDGGLLITTAGDVASRQAYVRDGTRNDRLRWISVAGNRVVKVAGIVTDPEGGISFSEWGLFNASQPLYWASDQNTEPYDQDWNANTPSLIPPWGATPAPTVTRNDVAAEANWVPVP